MKKEEPIEKRQKVQWSPYPIVRNYVMKIGPFCQEIQYNEVTTLVVLFEDGKILSYDFN